MTSQPEEFEPETIVDPAEGIWEGDAVETLESQEDDEREDFLDAERREAFGADEDPEDPEE